MTDSEMEDLYSDAEWYAMEDGIYYDWIHGLVSQNDYDEFIENCIEKQIKEIKSKGGAQ